MIVLDLILLACRAVLLGYLISTWPLIFRLFLLALPLLLLPGLTTAVVNWLPLRLVHVLIRVLIILTIIILPVLLLLIGVLSLNWLRSFALLALFGLLIEINLVHELVNVLLHLLILSLFAAFRAGS